MRALTTKGRDTDRPVHKPPPGVARAPAKRVAASPKPSANTPGPRAPDYLSRRLQVGRANDLHEQAAERTAETLAAPSAASSDAASPSTPALSAGGASPLPDALRRRFEARLGADLGHLRVHRGPEAAVAVRAVNARAAFTVGSDIVLGDDAPPFESPAGEHLLAHEVAHTLQPGADGVVRRDGPLAPDPGPMLGPRQAPLLGPDVDPAVIDPDFAMVPPQVSDVPDEALAPAETIFEPVVDPADPAGFTMPAGASREEVALTLYGDRSHFGGFDILRQDYVRLRNLDGVLPEVAALMRAGFEEHLPRDVDAVVEVLKERIISEGDERQLLAATVWWSSRSDFKDAQDRSYFDRYLDALDGRKLTMERPIISDITHTALEWLLDEADERASEIYQLIARRSARGPMRIGDFRPAGPLAKGATVGSYNFRTKRPSLAIGEWNYLVGEIRVSERVVEETSAARAEIALRNAPQLGPRLLIPGGDGRFYGYTIDFPRLAPGYLEPVDKWNTNQPPQHIDDWFWHYPGTLVIQGGEFNPTFPIGGEAEGAQRQDILARAMTAGPEAQHGLDFDVLALATLDQRMTLLEAAIGRHESTDASLVARVLYSTPAADFPRLERRMSLGDLMERLLRMPGPSGQLAVVGRIFTVKSLESMQVAGETLEDLPEFTAGFDEDGYVHTANYKLARVASNFLADAEFGRAGQVSIGHERALPGEASSSTDRAVLTIQPMIIRIGSLAGMLGRKFVGSLSDNIGPPVGPLLPTQLVRVTLLGTPPQTRIVTAVEAAGLLDPPTDEMLKRLIEATTHGYMWLMAGMGLAQAFGPAFAEGLLASGEARGVGAALLTQAGTEAGASALLSSTALAAMAEIDSHREEFAATPAGRTFLELYDAAMLIWVAHDATRLIVSGLIPKLAASIDAIIAAPGALRNAVLPLREEVEAFRRAIQRYSTPAEAAEAAVAGGGAMALGGEARQPGFFAMLRVTRGEVAAEGLMSRLAGSGSAKGAKKILDRLESLIQRSETAATRKAADVGAAEAATKTGESAAAARLNLARRAAQLRPDARDAFLAAAERIVDSRPNSLGSLTDFLSAAARSRQPTTFLAEVQKLVDRKGLTDEALAVLGKKAYSGVLTASDLAWLNRTSLTDDVLDFLASDKRTPWAVYRRAAEDPLADNAMRNFRTSARGAGAEIVAGPEAAARGTNVARQVPMGSSEIDYAFTIGRRRFGFEIKGWTVETWGEALDAAIKRLNKKALTAEERQAVRKIDNMLQQLQDAKAATGSDPYLGLTDALKTRRRAQLDRILKDADLTGTTIVPLSETAIKKTAAVSIGEAVGAVR